MCIKSIEKNPKKASQLIKIAKYRKIKNLIRLTELTWQVKVFDQCPVPKSIFGAITFSF